MLLHVLYNWLVLKFYNDLILMMCSCYKAKTRDDYVEVGIKLAGKPVFLISITVLSVSRFEFRHRYQDIWQTFYNDVVFLT